MSKRIVRYECNTKGTDVVVGDIHGHFSSLQHQLDLMEFNPATDRLFSVGDLVDRGPESDQVLEWLDKPWFHPVRGNHDDYVVRHQTCDRDNWLLNGGAWFQGLPSDIQAEMSVQFAELPIAIEVMTQNGMIGIVHAECPFPRWEDLQNELLEPTSAARLKQVAMSCMWSRNRIEIMDEKRVSGVLAVVVGHTPVTDPYALGNTIYIDTMAWRDCGKFTFLDLSSVR